MTYSIGKTGAIDDHRGSDKVLERRLSGQYRPRLPPAMKAVLSKPMQCLTLAA